MNKNDKSFGDSISGYIGVIEANIPTAKQLISELPNLGVNDGTDALRRAIVNITDASVEANKQLRKFNSARYQLPEVSHE